MQVNYYIQNRHLTASFQDNLDKLVSEYQTILDFAQKDMMEIIQTLTHVQIISI